MVLSYVRRVLWPTVCLPLPFKSPYMLILIPVVYWVIILRREQGVKGRKVRLQQSKQTQLYSFLHSFKHAGTTPVLLQLPLAAGSCVYTAWLCLHAFLGLLCSSFPCWVSLGGIPACLSLFEGWQLPPVLPVGTFFSPVICLSLHAGLWALFSWFDLATSVVDVLCLAQQASCCNFLRDNGSRFFVWF